MAIDQELLKNELIRIFQMEEMSPEKQEELLSKMSESLLNRIFLETMKKMGNEGFEEYKRVLEGDASEEQFQAFFEGKIPGYDAFVQTVVDQFKEEMQKSLESHA